MGTACIGRFGVHHPAEGRVHEEGQGMVHCGALLASTLHPHPSSSSKLLCRPSCWSGCWPPPYPAPPTKMHAARGTGLDMAQPA